MKIKVDFNRIIGYFNLDSEKGLSIDALRDWKVLLVSFSVLLVVVSGVDAYSLMKSKDGVVAPPAPAVGGTDIKINENALKEVLDEVDARARVFSINSKALPPLPVATSTPQR